MRLLEFALLVSEVLAIAALAGQGRRLPLALSGLATIMALLQVGVEGPRWQMLPGYGLAAVLLGWSALRFARPTTAPTWRRIAGGVGLALWAVVAGFLPWFIPVFAFPTPDGAFGIGTETFHWTDADRAELFATDPSVRRELMV